MLNYLIYAMLSLASLFQVASNFNKEPANQAIERIDQIAFTDTLFHTVKAQHYTLSDFHCSLFFMDSTLLKINVFGIHPHLLYLRSYYFENESIFAVVNHNFKYKNYQFLAGKNVQELSSNEILQLDSLEYVETTNFYYEADSLVALTGADTFLLQQPQMMYNQANDYLIYYDQNLKTVAGR